MIPPSLKTLLPTNGQKKRRQGSHTYFQLLEPRREAITCIGENQSHDLIQIQGPWEMQSLAGQLLPSRNITRWKWRASHCLSSLPLPPSKPLSCVTWVKNSPLLVSLSSFLSLFQSVLHTPAVVLFPTIYQTTRVTPHTQNKTQTLTEVHKT